MNKNLQKTLCILLALVTLFSFAACGKEKRAKNAPLTPMTKPPATPKPVRNTMTFGHYEQDNDLTNGAEPIEWIILETEADGTLLLMSRYALDCVPYNAELLPVAWKTCTLRAWLNDRFYSAAFGEEEQTKIVTTLVPTEETPHYMAIGEYATADKVWLLSMDEADSYFSEDAVMLCIPTSYALSRGANQSEEYALNGVPSCWWWLRSTGDDSNRASFINDFGVIGDFGNIVNYDHYTIRPVIRIQP